MTPRVAALLLLAALLAACSAASAGPPPGEQVVEVTIRHSKFLPAEIEVRRGTTVRFVIVNTDPIDHEFILGDAAVHALHANGTHAQHGEVPGEVSVEAMGWAETTYTFDRRGSLLFACHLPGHLAYGMYGTITVE